MVQAAAFVWVKALLVSLMAVEASCLGRTILLEVEGVVVDYQHGLQLGVVGVALLLEVQTSKEGEGLQLVVETLPYAA